MTADQWTALGNAWGPLGIALCGTFVAFLRYRLQMAKIRAGQDVKAPSMTGPVPMGFLLLAGALELLGYYPEALANQKTFAAIATPCQPPCPSGQTCRGGSCEAVGIAPRRPKPRPPTEKRPAALIMSDLIVPQWQDRSVQAFPDRPAS